MAKKMLGLFRDTANRLYEYTESALQDGSGSWSVFSPAPTIGLGAYINAVNNFGIWGDPDSNTIITTADPGGNTIRFNHYDGTSWSVKEAALAGGTYAVRIAANSTDSTEIYALSATSGGGLWQFNGTSWIKDTGYDTIISGQPAWGPKALWVGPNGEVWVGGSVNADSTAALYHKTAAGVWSVVTGDLVRDREVLDIWGADDDNVWCACDNGYIEYWNGSTFADARPIGANYDVESIWGIDANNVWALTNRGASANSIVYWWNGASWIGPNDDLSYGYLWDSNNKCNCHHLRGIDLERKFAGGKLLSGVSRLYWSNNGPNWGKQDAYDESDLWVFGFSYYDDDPAIGLPTSNCTLPKIEGDGTITNYDCLKSQHRDITNGGGVVTTPFSLGTRFLHIRKPK